ncbi:flagellar hook-length control protein FliK [Paracoccus sediminilitoris]|uniref:flagellar hook-length control protein FliK n=1 Tax=Paracoccus sediminilitoris TaxID=2202419 RepID=UPI000DBA799E|nr:flagellar hook-length control protein FliK [Paracoccus sediminilitoris]
MSDMHVTTSLIPVADMPPGIAPTPPTVDSGFDPGLLDWTIGTMQVAPKALTPGMPVMPKGGDPLAQWLLQASGISADFAPPASVLPPEFAAMVMPAPAAPMEELTEAELIFAPVPEPEMAIPSDMTADAMVATSEAPVIPTPVAMPLSRETFAEAGNAPPNAGLAVSTALQTQDARVLATTAGATPKESSAQVPAVPTPVQPTQPADAQPPVAAQATVMPQPLGGKADPRAQKPAPAPAVDASGKSTLVPPDGLWTGDPLAPAIGDATQSVDPVQTERLRSVADGLPLAPKPAAPILRDASIIPDQAAALDVQPLQPHREASSSAAPALTPSHAPAPHADPRPVMQQVTSAMVTTRKDATEIALSPEELGRLRVVMSGPDRNHVTIWAERPETLDLVRRNADMLVQHLQEAGIDTMDMEFRQDHGGPWQDGDEGIVRPDLDDTDRPVTTRMQIATPPVSDRRVDIRL